MAASKLARRTWVAQSPPSTPKPRLASQLPSLGFGRDQPAFDVARGCRETRSLMDGWVVHPRGARTGLAGRYRLSASEGMRTRPERAIVCGARLDHARMFDRASDGTAASGPPFVFLTR